MSHSKMTKRRHSRYVESLNPEAKNFINTCSLCGARGYSPSIEEPGFTEKNYIHRAIYAELTRILKPLPLDGLGRCEVCAATMDKASK